MRSAPLWPSPGPTASEGSVVVRRTISDWYTNAEGRNSSDSRHDWENDDQPDRTPDVWLDRLKPTDRAGYTRSSRGSASTGTSGKASRRTVPTRRDLADAARGLRERMPGIKDSTIVRHLRQDGWSQVSVDQVRAALRAHPAPPRRQPLPNRPSEAPKIAPKQQQDTVTVISPRTAAKPASTPAAARGRQTLAEVARAMRAKYPQLGMKKLTKQVQGRGWPMATLKQVEAALQEPRATRPVRSRPASMSFSAVRAPQPDTCFACGVVPSILGTCRCS